MTLIKKEFEEAKKNYFNNLKIISDLEDIIYFLEKPNYQIDYVKNKIIFSIKDRDINQIKKAFEKRKSIEFYAYQKVNENTVEMKVNYNGL